MATLDDDLAKAVTEGFRLAQSSIINQDLILSGTGDVTVTLADGSKKTGPSWTKLIAQAGAAGASAAAAAASEKNAKTSETNANSSKTAAASSASAAKTSETNAKTSETNAKTSENNAKTSENNAAASASSAAASLAAAQLLTSVPYEEAPFPDVWLPLNDDMRLLAGSAPYDRLTISGQVLELPTKSATFTRSTIATYIDKSGVLKTAAMNEPRFEREGLLMEGQSTNYILNSDDPSKWENGTQLTKTVLAIDGQSQSVTGKFVVNSETTVSSMVRSTAINVAVGDTVTTSGRAKCSYGLIRVLFRIDTVTAALAYIDPNNPSYDNKSGPITITTQAIQDGYVYFTATLTAATAGNCDSYISANKAGSDAVIPVGAEYYLQMPQTEKNPVATSYIPTGAAAVTRAADNVILQASGNCGLRLTSDLIQRSVSFELTVNSCGLTSGTLDVLETYGAAYDKILRLSIAGSYALATYRSGTLTAISGSYPFYRKTVAHTLDGNAVAIYFDGKSNRRDAAPYSPTAAAQYLKISSNSAVVYHIRNLRIWHRVLTPNQINGLR
ncbi:phage head spike fiber domain-containing protein [Leclercia adecarboxylata]|uniref:phage head spike fiber domain-containing protein n=1 Tax=Leclercia adecarboxylata TaxID=83655 RepID=UPI00370C5E16